MRLFALAAILALGVLIGLSDEKAPGAGKNGGRSPMAGPRPHPQPVMPNYPQWQPNYYRPGGGGYRPNMKPARVTIDVTFTYNSDVGKVRSYDPPENFDDKGNVKKYKKEELAALKGDTPAEKKLIGYKADLSEVKVGDYVQISLSVNKNAPPKAAKKAKGKKKEDEEDADADKKKDKDKEDKLAAKPAPKDGRWVVAAQFVGKVTRVDGGGSESDGKMTVQISMMQYGRGGNQKQNIDPEVAQATLIVIAKRPAAPPARQ